VVGNSVGCVGCGARGEGKGLRAAEDVALEPYQYELLEFAFEAASAMPLEPHIKNRSRAQEMVVLACMELKQPQQARPYIERIANWRRGAAYADLAFYYARDGAANEAEPYLQRAAQVSEEAEDWRRDRIRIKIAQTYEYMGQTEAAAPFKQGVDVSESAKLARVEAMTCSPDSFDERIDALEKLASADNFDAVRSALGAYAELFGRFYGDVERRARAEQKIRAVWDSMPPFIQIEPLLELAGFALRHEDQVKALDLVNEAKAVMGGASWRPRVQVPLMARLAELRFRAGDEEQARIELKQALDLFEAKQSQIVNIYRAETLHPVAEAYQAMGETARALEIYGRAVEAGMENPNSRPRAEDLTATCCSMAVHAVEPDADLWGRIREIRDGLGDPW
jgi:tetratricopeptide (TPR) repeat protein